LSYDVTSSVPRVSLSLSTGTWIPGDIDIYDLILQEYFTLKILDLQEKLKSLEIPESFENSENFSAPFFSLPYSEDVCTVPNVCTLQNTDTLPNTDTLQNTYIVRNAS